MIQQNSQRIIEKAKGDQPSPIDQISPRDIRKPIGGVFDSGMYAISDAVSKRPGLMLLTGFTLGAMASYVAKRRK